MRNLFFKKMILAAIVLPLAFVGCSEDDDDSSNPNGSSNENSGGNEFTFVKDGVSYDYSEHANVIYAFGEPNVSGRDQAYPSDIHVQVNINDSLKVGGVYEFKENSTEEASASYTDNTIITDDSITVSYRAVDGEIQLNSFNEEEETIAGTFHFTGISHRLDDTVRITNGQFNIVK